MSERRTKTVLGPAFEQRPKMNDNKENNHRPPQAVVRPGSQAIGPDDENSIGVVLGNVDLREERRSKFQAELQGDQVGSAGGSGALSPWLEGSYATDFGPMSTIYATPGLSMTSRLAQAPPASKRASVHSTPLGTRKSSRCQTSEGRTHGISPPLITPGTQNDPFNPLTQPEPINLPFPSAFSPAYCRALSRATPLYSGRYIPGTMSRRRHAPSSSRTVLDPGSEDGGRDERWPQSESRPGGPVTRSLTKWVDENICRCGTSRGDYITPANFLIQVEKFLTTDKDFAKYEQRWDRDNLLSAIGSVFPGAIQATSSRPVGEPPVITGLAMRRHHLTDVDENEDDRSTQIDGSTQNRASGSEGPHSLHQGEYPDLDDSPNYQKGFDILLRNRPGRVAHVPLAPSAMPDPEGLADLASQDDPSPPLACVSLPVFDDNIPANIAYDDFQDTTISPSDYMSWDEGVTPSNTDRKRKRSPDGDDDDDEDDDDDDDRDDRQEYTNSRDRFLADYMKWPIAYQPSPPMLNHVKDQVEDVAMLGTGPPEGKGKGRAKPAPRKRSAAAPKAKGKAKASVKSEPSPPCVGDELVGNDNVDAGNGTKTGAVALRKTKDGTLPGVDCLPVEPYSICIFHVLNESKYRRLRIQGLYHELGKKYPYFASLNVAERTSFENSIRHNLSLHRGETWFNCSASTINSMQDKPDTRWMLPIQPDEAKSAPLSGAKPDGSEPKGGFWSLLPGATIGDMVKKSKDSAAERAAGGSTKRKAAGPKRQKGQRSKTDAKAAKEATAEAEGEGGEAEGMWGPD